MNKQEAAQFLGVSVRTLETYVAQNRLAVRYVKGKTRPVADFESGDLERLKTEIPPIAGRVVNAQTTQNPANLPETRNSASSTSQNLATSQNGRDRALAQLAKKDAQNPIVVIEAEHLHELLAAALAANSENSAANSATPQNLAAKMLLTLPEAQNLTGLSRDTLKKAMASGDLPARQMGKAWRLRPEDVRDWLQRHFATPST